MAFCTQCGRKLAEGEVCTCQKGNAKNGNPQYWANNQGGNPQQGANRYGNPQQQGVNQAGNPQRSGANQNNNPQQQGVNRAGNPQQQGAYGQNTAGAAAFNIDTEALNNIKKDSKKFANNIFSIFLQVLQRPAEVGRNFVLSRNIAAAFTFIILQGIFSGLIGVVCVGKINGMIDDTIAGTFFTKGYAKEISSILREVKFESAKVFFITVIGSVIISMALALITWAMVMLAKGRASFANMACAVGVRCIGMIPVTIVALLLLFVSVKVFAVIYIISPLIGYIFMGCALSDGTLAERNRMPYIFFATVVLTLAVHFVTVANLAPMYFSDTVRLAYKSSVHKIKSYMEKIEYEEIIEDTLYGLRDLLD